MSFVPAVKQSHLVGQVEPPETRLTVEIWFIENPVM